MTGKRRTSGREVLLGWASAVTAAVLFAITGWGWYSVGHMRLCLPGDESRERWCKVSAVSQMATAKKLPPIAGGRGGTPHYGGEEFNSQGLYECVAGAERDGCAEKFGIFVKIKSADALHESYLYHATNWNQFFAGDDDAAATHRLAFGIAVAAVFAAFLIMLVKITLDWLNEIAFDNDW